ncbi:ribosomal protein S6 kinase alpha-5-like [Scylla paramamosain]|uniref:ribosomal protein S6 kinase alpha-5-like n=1 Tax=Scylla paramamosain TaxID=85552 RepID=UPI0030834F37
MIPQDSPAIIPPDVEKMFNGYSYVAPSILFTDSVISDSSSLFKMSPDRRPSTTNLLLACSFKAHTYIVMELLGGGELAASEDQETREVHRGSPRASVVVRNLVSAVHYMHRKGISVHGDLKPDRGEELGEGEEICWELMEWEGIKIEKWLVLRIDRKEKKGKVKKRKFFCIDFPSAYFKEFMAWNIIDLHHLYGLYNKKYEFIPFRYYPSPRPF